MKIQEILEIIDTEPELPGDTSFTIRQAISTAIQNEDIDFFIEAMRLAVRKTKKNIRNRVKKQFIADKSHDRNDL